MTLLGKPEILQDIENINTSLDENAKFIESTDGGAISLEIASYSSQGYKIKFKRMVYETTATIFVPDNAEVDWNNCFIKRQAGSTVFDMIRNANSTTGNSNLNLKNLIIDGNKDADSLVATTPTHRFSGLRLDNVTNSILENIIVMGTVNAENKASDGFPSAGIFFVNCDNINCSNIDGYNNDRTAIFIWNSKVKINNSITYNNLGSGISSDIADESEYYNILTYNNGYSNLSVNGLRSKINNVISYGSSYSGVNIGHSGSPSDDTIAMNIHSYGNHYEGLTIGGSNRVQVIGLNVYGNALTTGRENIRVFDGSNNSKILNVISHDCTTAGIRYYSGSGHILDCAEFYNNVAGVYVDVGVTVTLGSGVKTHNNTDGIILSQSTNCKVNGSETFDNSNYGLWLAGGSGHQIINIDAHNNTVKDIQETSSPSNIYYNTKQNNNIIFQPNNYLEVFYQKTGISDEVATNVFSCNLEDSGRLSIEFTITCFYPSSSSAGVMTVKGLATACSNSSGTMISNVSSTLISSSSLTGITQTLVPTISNDETNNKINFVITQNNEPNDGAEAISIDAKIVYSVGTSIRRATVTLL